MVLRADNESFVGISIDGTCLCATLRPYAGAVHLLVAVDHHTGLVLSQTRVDEKTSGPSACSRTWCSRRMLSYSMRVSASKPSASKCSTCGIAGSEPSVSQPPSAASHENLYDYSPNSALGFRTTSPIVLGSVSFCGRFFRRGYAVGDRRWCLRFVGGRSFGGGFSARLGSVEPGRGGFIPV